MSNPQTPRQRIIQAGWDGLKGDPSGHDGGSVDGYLAAAREALTIARERLDTQHADAQGEGATELYHALGSIDDLLASLTELETPDGTPVLPAVDDSCGPDRGVEPQAMEPSVTPDAALLEEADKLISALHPGSGRGTVYRLIAALRASLDRERHDVALIQCQGEYIKASERERDTLRAELKAIGESHAALARDYTRALSELARVTTEQP